MELGRDRHGSLQVHFGTEVDRLHLGRKRWKRNRGYHKRSLAETGMARYKRILGPQLAARTWEGQQTEARIGCSILNQMIHLGKPESYPVELNS